MSGGRETPRGSQGSARQVGVVSGYLLKLVRESVGATQSHLAEHLRVDVATVQGWESGRRPLTALRTADFIRLRHKLIGLGAVGGMAQLFHEAIEADLVISHAIDAGDRPSNHVDHPLAASVHRRALTNMITWPLTGWLPSQLHALSRPATARRGPVPDRPVLAAADRKRFFDHLLVTADANTTNDTALLRRQAIYLLGFGQREDVASWLRTEQRRALAGAHRVDHVPSWVAVRSSAVALARNGNREPLERFVATALTDRTQQAANLNYWAYWVGEFDEVQPDDHFMVATSTPNWAGTRLLSHLLRRLQPGSDHAELNIHTLWALVLARPFLLEQHPHLRTQAAVTVEQANDDALSARGRQELASLAYAIRLAQR